MASNDTVWVPILPSFKGFARDMDKGTKGAGTAAGNQIAKELESAVSKAERAVTSAAGAAEKAQNRVADATGKVRVAQEKYNQALKTGDPVKIARAEEDLAKTRRDQVTATNSAEAANKKLAGAQDDAARAAREQADAVEVSSEALGGMDGKVSDLVGKLAGLAAGFAGVAGAAGLLALGFDVDSQIANMNAQLGLTGEAAALLGDEVGQVMRGGVASSAEEAAGAVGALSSQFNYLGFEGEKTAGELSRNFLAFTQTFGTDMAETTQTVGQLVSNGLAADVTDGIDLLTASFQQVPAAMRDELPEIINEYGTHFRGLGFSGEEAFGLLVSAADKGKWALDKTGDSLKEFQIRGSDMSKTSTDAYELLGLSAEDMSRKIVEGGPAARDALSQTAQALLGMEDPALRANTAIALFGTPLEDLSVDQVPQFLEALTGADAAMAGFSGSSEEIAQSIEQSLQGRLNTLKGTVADLAGNAFMQLWDAATRVSEWAQSNSTWLVPLTIGLGTLVGIVGGIVAATWAWNTALGVYRTIQAIATGQQLLFNAALLANPITWVVIAIAALVAGLAYFFTQTETGKRVWDAFTGALLAGWEWVMGAFAAAWAVISPIFTGIMNAAKMVAGVVVTGFLLYIRTYWFLVSNALLLAWNMIIKPIFNAFAAVATWLWTAVLMPVFGFIKTGFQLVGAAFSFYWNNVIKPVWNALGAGISWVWANVIRPAWDALKAALASVGDFFTWVWNSVIKPAWDALGAGIRWVWDNVVNPVFEGIKRGLDLVRSAFRTAVDIIGSVWNEMREKTAAPIRFVIDTVYNKGIVAVWNKVAGWLGMDDKTLDVMPLTFASGGVMPGYTPGRDVHKFINPATGQGLHLSGGEAIMRPEWTRAVGGAAAVDRMNRDARYGRMDKHGRESAAFADGGVLAFAAGGVVEAMTRIVQQKYPMLSMTSGYRNSNDNHGAGLAADFSNGSGNTPAQLALANDIANTYPGSMELIYDSPGWDRNIKNGAFVGPFGQFYTWAQAGNHQHHVHWAMNTPPTMPFGGGVFEGGSDGSGGGGGFSAVGSLVTKAMDAIMNPIMSAIPEGPGLVGGLAKGFGTKVYDEFKGWISSMVPASSGGNVDWDVSAGVEQWRELAVQALARHGYNPSQHIDAMLKQIEFESGGNPNAVNNWDINAVNGVPSGGLLQVIEPTYRRVRGAYADAFAGLPDDRFHPLTNLTAGVGAVRADWGGPAGRWPTRGGYHDGGLTPAGQGWLPKTALEPEFVLNPAMTQAFIDWMSGNPAAGSQWGLIKSLIISTAELLDPLRLIARDGRDLIRVVDSIARTARADLQGRAAELAMQAWQALPAEMRESITDAATLIGAAADEVRSAFIGGDHGYAALEQLLGTEMGRTVSDAAVLAGSLETAGRMWGTITARIGDKAIAWSKGEWPIGSGRVIEQAAGPEWLAFTLDERLDDVARSNLELADKVIAGELSPGNDPVANALFDIFGRDPLLPDLQRIAAGGSNAVVAATEAAWHAFETGETARLEEWTSSNSQLTEAVLRARDAAIVTGEMVQGAVNGYLNWAMASDSQGRMGSWQEYFQHYGGEYGTAQGDWLLSQVGLGGIIGGKFKDSFANLLIATAESPLLSAPAILDDSGRVIGTQLSGAAAGTAEVAPELASPVALAEPELAATPVMELPEEALGLETEASAAGTQVTVEIPEGKTALSIEEFKEILVRIDERLDEVEIAIDGEADPAPLGLGVGGIA